MDNQLVALDPHQMAQAQTWLIEWCDRKMQMLQGELDRAHNIIIALREGKMSDASGRRLVTGVRKRMAFYSKIKAALAEGYYILPPIDHQIFAVRSSKVLPRPNESTWRHQNDVKGETLPVGDGEYRNAVAVREHSWTDTGKNSQGQPVDKHYYANTDWREVEFPFFPVKPEIIEATGKALSKKIFDWLGVAPPYRTADPMVIGCIKHYKQYQRPIHFFVAWWLDVDTL